tara:strand:- start:497 stop:904 length:408 start_codon:yes stop_codon:yes gene_type:complete
MADSSRCFSVSLDLQYPWEDKGAAAKDGGPKDSNGYDHAYGFVVASQEPTHQQDNHTDQANVVHCKEQLLCFTECRSEVSGLKSQYTPNQHHTSLAYQLGYRKGDRVVFANGVLVATAAIDFHVGVSFSGVENRK